MWKRKREWESEREWESRTAMIDIVLWQTYLTLLSLLQVWYRASFSVVPRTTWLVCSLTDLPDDPGIKNICHNTFFLRCTAYAIPLRNSHAISAVFLFTLKTQVHVLFYNPPLTLSVKGQYLTLGEYILCLTVDLVSHRSFWIISIKR